MGDNKLKYETIDENNHLEYKKDLLVKEIER